MAECAAHASSGDRNPRSASGVDWGGTRSSGRGGRGGGPDRRHRRWRRRTPERDRAGCDGDARANDAGEGDCGRWPRGSGGAGCDPDAHATNSHPYRSSLALANANGDAHRLGNSHVHARIPAIANGDAHRLGNSHVHAGVPANDNGDPHHRPGRRYRAEGPNLSRVYFRRGSRVGGGGCRSPLVHRRHNRGRGKFDRYPERRGIHGPWGGEVGCTPPLVHRCRDWRRVAHGLQSEQDRLSRR